jgi:hypothetical protein
VFAVQKATGNFHESLVFFDEFDVMAIILPYLDFGGRVK